MLAIYKGSTAEVKKEMKEQKKQAIASKKALVKKYKGKLEKATNTDALAMIECEKVDTFFTVTTTIPVWLDDFLVNYQLLREFERRLKGYMVTMHIEEDRIQGRTLHIAYKDWYSRSKGKLILHELPKDIFKRLTSIPHAVQVGVTQ